MDLRWQWFKFHEFTPSLLYQVLKLRQDVFVVEQNCPYPELDDKDQDSLHLVGFDQEEIAATTRVVPPGISYPELSLGRVVVSPKYRGKGLGHILLTETLNGILQHYGTVAVKISAQTHLQSYYQAAGFHTVGEAYLEDGFPHVAMVKPASV